MVILIVFCCMKGIIHAKDDLMDQRNVRNALLDLEKKLSSEQKMRTLCLFGDDLLTTASTSEPVNDKRESIAPSLETNRRTLAQNLFVRRTQLLMSYGLICGIIPTSTAKRSPQKTLDFVLSKQAGDDAG